MSQGVMTTDLKILVATAVLAMLQFFPYFMAYLKHWGIRGIVGNRDDVGPLPPWAQRALAAHRNMTENFAHFAVLVLVAHIAGASNEMSAIGALIFLVSRLAHWVLYILGVKWLRSMAFMGGFVGEIIILLQIVKIVG